MYDDGDLDSYKIRYYKGTHIYLKKYENGNIENIQTLELVNVIPDNVHYNSLVLKC